MPRRRRALQIICAVGLCIAVVISTSHLDVAQMGRILRQANPIALVVVALIAFAGLAWKAAFWRFALSALSPVPFRLLLRYAVAAAVGSILAPARAGDAFRIWILRRRHGVPLSVTVTVAGLEKLGDVGAMVVLSAPLPWLVPSLSASVRPWLLALSGVPIVAVLAIALVRRHSTWSKLPLFAGLRIFDFGRPVASALACVFAAWLFDLATVEIVLYAVGTAPTLTAGLMVLLITNLAIAVPVTPGNVGAHELGSVLALKLLGVQVEIATAFALLYHGLHTVPVLFAGFVDARRLLVDNEKEPSSAGSR
ncbi:MAG TPA: lysylphosphatidylglycerol synthase transmembrane domain-containing protein [Polyangiaceae bacterium]|nr:lysylphosphatidylglycerol synthase transmembrane domain-containing protein [Polyangiaceae bacterium]